jgi:hypothetical protein
LIRPSILRRSLIEARLLNGKLLNEEGSSISGTSGSISDDAHFIDEVTKRVEVTFET